MEQETELYLVKRIKELESQNAFLEKQLTNYRVRDEIDDEIIRERLGTPTKDVLSKALDSHFIDTFKGYDINKLFEKAKAFDVLNELIGVEACYFPNDNYYELVCWRIGGKVRIDEEKFKLFREVLTNGEQTSD